MLVAGVYDGDTQPTTRRKLRDTANLILSNPDMLHQGILPYHPRWARVPPQPALRGRRRDARVSRHLRLARRQRPAAARARRPPLRRASSATCRAAPRSATPASWRTGSSAATCRWSTTTARRAAEALRVLEPAVTRTPRAWSGARQTARAARCSRRLIEARRAGAGVHQVAGRRRSWSTATRSERLERATRAARRAHQPYRGGYLPEERAQIEQRAVLGRAARRGEHQRARAGRRHRRARRGGDDRRAADAGERVAAGRARRPQGRAPRWRCWSPTTRPSTST